MLTPSLLQSYEGQSIKTICPNGYDAPGDNHCAHFVSHALQLDFGLTCAQMSGKRRIGANIRVQELFAKCPATREVLECPTTGEGLIFVSSPSSFKHAGAIANVPKKHVGLVLGGMVWHYSNSHHRVQRQTVGQFLSHYPKQHNALWWGAFPPGSRPTRFATSS